MRAVIDTNIWIRRLLGSNSISARAADKALDESDVFISEPVVDELVDVLSREKWDRYVSVDERQEFLDKLLRAASPISVLSEIAECRDPKDDKFLALALDAEADYLITDDKDLLVLHPWRGIEILSSADFLAKFE